MITVSMGVLVAVGGGLGAAARFLVDTLIARHNRLSVPLGTVIINVTACLLLGMLTGLTLTHPGHEGLHAVLAIGFLGGYSTFSTASVECARLFLASRALTAGLQAVGMLVASVAAAVVGLWITGDLALDRLPCPPRPNDVPLRDIGTILGVSHQRAHQLVSA